jgi:hypothetical protein
MRRLYRGLVHTPKEAKTMRKMLLSATALTVLLSGIAHAQETEFTAVLETQAVLPANTLIPAPADGPAPL